MHEHPPGGAGIGLLDVTVVILAMIAIVGYGWAVHATRSRSWPRIRIWFWIAGVVAAAMAVVGPLSKAAHHSFTAHMITHLLLGMLAPLLLVLAAPITLLLRALPVTAARVLTRVLRTVPARVITDPIVAAILNVGGLWALYTTGLYPAMHTSPALHLLIHAHMFLAGYLFTAAVITIDPMPHRRGHLYRAIVLIVALAGHDILAKYLYGHPPAQIATSDAETGAMLMYYGGDAVDLVLIVFLCARWYRAARPMRQQAVPGHSS